MPRSQLEMDQLDDLEVASQVELDTVKDNMGGGFLPVYMNNYALYQSISGPGSAGGDCNIITLNAKDRTDYWVCNTTTYQIFGNFIFRGTSVWTPSYFKGVVSLTNVNRTGYLRIYDVTNALQVCEMSFTGFTTKSIVQTSTLTNLPTSEALFEFQVKQSATSVYVHAAGLYK